MTTTNQNRTPRTTAVPATTGVTPPDPRVALLRAADQAVAVVGLVTPDRLAAPTPCAEYDVRHLTGHLVAVLRRIAYVAGGGHAFDVPSIVLDVPEDRWAAAAAANAAGLRAAWSDDAVLDRVLRLPWGEVPGRGAAMAYVQELTTHAWDLAAALGRPDVLDPRLAELALVAAHRYLPAQPRGGPIPFEAPVEVAADAPPYDRLVAWLGRDPQWSAG
jgi:uncharacterized protein (TIGR03086 family)